MANEWRQHTRALAHARLCSIAMTSLWRHRRYLERIIHPEELDKFGGLASHQMAQKSTGACRVNALVRHFCRRLPY
jgi:hypothetical protein